jgi:hypothetical protein
MDCNNLSLMGGAFSLFVLIHFVVDWIFQTHKEAMIKHVSPLIRAKHCLIYTVGFFPLMLMFKFEYWELYFGTIILFFSHYIEDTYVPVYWWAKYIRKPKEMVNPDITKIFRGDNWADYPANDKEGFIQFSNTPIGKILTIVIDQVIHIVFLIPLAWMATN